MTIRNERMAEQIRAELSVLIREEVSDPRIGLVSLTRVKLAPDLGSALVFYSPLMDLSEEAFFELDDGLASSSGFLRRQLGRRLSLRHVPELRFRYDDSTRQGSETLALLHELAEHRDAGADTEGERVGKDPEAEEEDGQAR